MSGRLLCVLAVAGLLAPAATSGAERQARAPADSTQALDRFWTPARMRSAVPLDYVRGGEGSVVRADRKQLVPFTSLAVPDPTVPPASANGKLFGTLRGIGAYECSATVVHTASRSVVLTAGHCVFDPLTQRFGKQLRFVPAYGDGAQPLGNWGWSHLATTRQWVRWQNSNFDYAAIAFRKHDGVALEDVAGGRELVTNAVRNQDYTAVGYPGNRDDGQTMWSCASHYGGDDPRPFRIGKPPMAIGCDMQAGASGGGWFTDAGGLASLSSFGYRRKPDVLYGPYLTVKAARLVARVSRGR